MEINSVKKEAKLIYGVLEDKILCPITYTHEEYIHESLRRTYCVMLLNFRFEYLFFLPFDTGVICRCLERNPKSPFVSQYSHFLIYVGILFRSNDFIVKNGEIY